MRKTALVLVAALLITALSVGFVQAANTDLKGKITVWSWNIAAKSLQALIPEFNKEYPNIEVDLKMMGSDDVYTKLTVALSSGVGAPDIASMQDRYIPGFIDLGGLADLTQWMKPYAKDFVGYKLAAVEKDGHYYAVPWDAGPMAMYYRRDRFQEAGIDPTISTWDQFIEVGKKMTNDTNGDGQNDQFMVGFPKAVTPSKSATDDLFEGMLWEAEGGMFNKKGEVVFDNPGALKVLKTFEKIRDTGIGVDAVRGTPGWNAAMKNGDIAVEPNAVWVGGMIKDVAPETAGKWGVVPMPAFYEGGPRGSNNGGSTLLIPDQSKNKELAWKFVEFSLARKESQLTMYKLYELFPALKTTFDDPFFDQPVEFWGNQKVRQVFAEVMNEIPDYFYGTNYREALKYAEDAATAVIQGQKTPEQAIKGAQQQIKTMLMF